MCVDVLFGVVGVLLCWLRLCVCVCCCCCCLGVCPSFEGDDLLFGLLLALLIVVHASCFLGEGGRVCLFDVCVCCCCCCCCCWCVVCDFVSLCLCMCLLCC